MKHIGLFAFAITALMLLNGCHLAAAAGAGAVAADEYEEAKECGDEFDPIGDITSGEACE